MAALRYFYGTTLRRPDIAAAIAVPRRTEHSPTVLAREEIERLLKAVGDLKMRTALTTIYSAGLRNAEAMRLTVQDIDSARMVICVRQGKRRKDRYTVLSQQLLDILRDYWRGRGRRTGCFPVAIHTADDQARAAAGLPASGQGGWAEQVGHRPHVATQFCDPSARTRGRHSRDPGLARASAHRDDRGLCSCCRLCW